MSKETTAKPPYTSTAESFSMCRPGDTSPSATEWTKLPGMCVFVYMYVCVCVPLFYTWVSDFKGNYS